MATFNEAGHFYAPPPGAHMQSKPPVAEGVPTLQVPASWTSGLLGFSSPGDCFVGCCAPCVMFGNISEYLRPEEACCAGDFGAACISFLCCSCFYCCFLEQFSAAVRKRFQIPGGSASDCAMACLCPCCILLRMKREVVARGAQTYKAEIQQAQQMLIAEQEDAALTAPEVPNAMPPKSVQ